jgi:hypothetical protein
VKDIETLAESDLSLKVGVDNMGGFDGWIEKDFGYGDKEGG